MTEKRKIEASKKSDVRYSEFLKYLQKRMKELEEDEKKFRDNIIKEKRVN